MARPLFCQVARYVIQFDIDPDSTLPGSGVIINGSVTVGPAFRTLTCAVLGVPTGFPECSSGLFGSGHRQVSYGTTSYNITGPLLTFTAPFSMLNETDGAFTYAIEDGPGGQVRALYLGTSGQTHVGGVPEPATIGPFTLGGLMASVSTRRKVSPSGGLPPSVALADRLTRSIVGSHKT